MKIKDQYKKAAIVVVGLAVLAIGFSAGRTLTPPADQMARMETAAEAEYRSGDEADAFALFTQLAERGSIPAATYLGEMYQTGTGTAKDGTAAIKWLTTAADAGNPTAARQLGLLYLDGTVAVQDFGLARKWLDAAARAGDDIAMRNLGDMDTQGLGAEADPVSAYAYYDAAASLGNRYGELQRDRIAGTLTADQQREGEKKADALIAALSPKPKPAAPSDKATAPKAAS